MARCRQATSHNQKQYWHIVNWTSRNTSMDQCKKDSMLTHWRVTFFSCTNPSMFGWENALQNICKIVAILFRPQGANLPLGICFSPAFFVQLCYFWFPWWEVLSSHWSNYQHRSQSQSAIFISECFLLRIYWWLSARLQWFQGISNGVTAVFPYWSWRGCVYIYTYRMPFLMLTGPHLQFIGYCQ